MRCECRHDQRMVGIRVMDEVGAFLQILFCVRSPARWEIHDRRSNNSPHRQVCSGLSDDLREEVLVTEASDAAAQHLGYGELCAIADHFRTYPAAFGGPDSLMQPCFEWHVVGKAPKQGHCRVGVGIDESRNQHVVRTFNEYAGLKIRLRLRGREYRKDTAVGNCHGMVFKDLVGGSHGDAPARYDQGVTVLHSRRSIPVAEGSASTAFQGVLQA